MEEGKRSKTFVAGTHDL